MAPGLLLFLIRERFMQFRFFLALLGLVLAFAFSGELSRADQSLTRAIDGFREATRGSEAPALQCEGAQSNPAFAKQTSSLSCQGQWNRWLNKYAAASPFAAFNKASYLKLDREILKTLLTGDPNSDAFFEALMKGAKQYQAAYQNALKKFPPTPMRESIVKDIFFESALKPWVPNSNNRDNKITRNIEKFIDQVKASSSDPKKLLLVYVGGAHIIDYFLTNPNQELVYASQQVTKYSTQGNKEFQIYIREGVKKNMRQNIAKLSLLITALNQSIADNRKMLKKTEDYQKRAEAALSRNPNDSEAQILLSDIIKIHKSLEKKLVDSERKLEEVKKMQAEAVSLLNSQIKSNDFQKIFQQVLEGDYLKIAANSKYRNTLFTDFDRLWNASPNLRQSKAILLSDLHGLNSTATMDELPAPACLKAMGFDSIDFAVEAFSFGKELSLTDVRNRFTFKLEKRTPEVAALLRDGKAQLYPNFMALLDKLEQYQKAGIKINITGIE